MFINSISKWLNFCLVFTMGVLFPSVLISNGIMQDMAFSVFVFALIYMIIIIIIVYIENERVRKKQLFKINLYEEK